MISDLVDVSEGRKIDTDICIVGGGAAGITLALQLIGRGIDVLVLESGGYKPDERIQDLYAGDVADELLHSPPDRFRQSVR